MIQNDEIVNADSDVSRKNKKSGATDAVTTNVRTANTFSSLEHHKERKSND
jgi:hypothetical protein